MKKFYNFNHPLSPFGRFACKMQSWIVNLIIPAVFLASAGSVSAQTVITESFETPGGAAANLPFGWTGGKISGNDVNNYVERTTTGGTPACTPQNGGAMLRYRSATIVAGPGLDQYFVSSPAYDLTNNPGTATVSFWMYKDNSNANKDSVTLYINNAPSPGAGMVNVMGPISRDSTGNGWRQYSAVIPAGFNNAQAFLVFVFTNRSPVAGVKSNIYIDNFSIVTWPKAMVLVSSTLHFQETSDVNKPSTDNLIVGIKVTCDGAGIVASNTVFKIDSIVTNVTGTSALTDLVNPSVKIWYTKGTNSFVNLGNQFGATVAPSFFRDRAIPSTPPFYLENGDNYFWVTLSVVAGAVSGNCIDVDFNGLYYSRLGHAGPDTSRTPLVSSLAGCRQIDVALCGGIIPTLSTGTSWLNGSYTNNDYIHRVYLRGANSVTPSYPYIDNNINDVGPAIAPWNSGPAPFTVHPPDYQQFSQTPNSLHPNITAVLVQGANYTLPAIVAGNPVGQGLALQCGTWSSSNYLAAWIDFNKDGALPNTLPERIVQSGNLNALGWVTSAVSVPGTATVGNVKMRVREVFATPTIVACQSGYTFGEIEDYIVSVIPSCPAGVKLWLGYTNDWNTPGNWCGGVPTINDVALIDEVTYLGGTQIGAPFDPVIHSGTVATAKSIRISSTDTLKINAPIGSSLQIADSLTISYNTPAGGGGKLIVNSAFSDTAQFSNGVSTFLITPFQANKKNMRMQLRYYKSNMLLKGMIAGDYVYELIFHIRQRANPSVTNYPGFTIKYATVDSTWNGWPAGPPTSLAPNTSAYVTLFGPATLTLPMAQGAGGILTVPLTTPMYWNGESDIVIEICFNSPLAPASVTGQDWVCQSTPVSNTNTVLWLNNTSTTPTSAGCVLNWTAGVLPSGTSAVSSQFRPNITFRFRRPYTMYPINVTGAALTAGRFVNHGTFTAGYSNVTFNNATMNQDIGGANVTTFNELTINKTGAIGTNAVIMGINANIDTTLRLTAGMLSLNQRTLTINNSLPSGIQRTNGTILSETVSPNYGTVTWNIGANATLHNVPFGTSTGVYIPFEYTNTSAANIGTLSVATYKTTPANTPWAASAGPYPITVMHMNGQSTGTDISTTDVVDRFWQLNKSIPGTSNANIKFSYQPGVAPGGEEPVGGPFTYVAQRFQAIGGLGSVFGGWSNRPGTFTAGSVTVTLTGDSIYGPWTLGNQSNPLPVQLLNFDAQLVTDKVQIWWSTASELDNDHFVVERTLDGKEFSFIDQVKSYGPSTKTQNYETYDHNPVEGIQYYRLKSVDVQGGFEYSKLVPVRFGKDGEFTINHINSNYSSNALDVVFTYDSHEPYTYSVVDILGRTLVSKSGNAAYPGMNTLTIPVNMNRGIYFVKIENSQRKVASKLIY